MIFETIIAVAVAFFAVTGLYFIIKTVRYAVFGGLTGAVVVCEEDSIARVECRIRMARSASPGGKCDVILLIPASRKDDGGLIGLAEKYYLIYYIMEN